MLISITIFGFDINSTKKCSCNMRVLLMACEWKWQWYKWMSWSSCMCRYCDCDLYTLQQLPIISVERNGDKIIHSNRKTSFSGACTYKWDRTLRHRSIITKLKHETAQIESKHLYKLKCILNYNLLFIRHAQQKNNCNHSSAIFICYESMLNSYIIP